MDPIDALTREHRLIEQVLQALYRAGTLGRTGHPVDLGLFTSAVTFIRRYADGVHHAKEERHLFPLLEQSGLPREGGPLGCMLSEHDGGRRYTEHIAQEVEVARSTGNAAAPLLYQAAQAYALHMVAHIQKEDGVLFVMARRLIDDEDMADLGAAFQLIDASVPGFEASATAIARMMEEAQAQANARAAPAQR